MESASAIPDGSSSSARPLDVGNKKLKKILIVCGAALSSTQGPPGLAHSLDTPSDVSIVATGSLRTCAASLPCFTQPGHMAAAA